MSDPDPIKDSGESSKESQKDFSIEKDELFENKTTIKPTKETGAIPKVFAQKSKNKTDDCSKLEEQRKTPPPFQQTSVFPSESSPKIATGDSWLYLQQAVSSKNQCISKAQSTLAPEATYASKIDMGTNPFISEFSSKIPPQKIDSLSPSKMIDKVMQKVLARLSPIKTPELKKQSKSPVKTPPKAQEVIDMTEIKSKDDKNPDRIKDSAGVQICHAQTKVRKNLNFTEIKSDAEKCEPQKFVMKRKINANDEKRVKILMAEIKSLYEDLVHKTEQLKERTLIGADPEDDGEANSNKQTPDQEQKSPDQEMNSPDHKSPDQEMNSPDQNSPDQEMNSPDQEMHSQKQNSPDQEQNSDISSADVLPSLLKILKVTPNDPKRKL